MKHFLTILILLLICQSSLCANVQEVEMGRYEVTVPNAFYQLNNLRSGDKIVASLTWNVSQYISLGFYEGKKLLQQTASTIRKLALEYSINRTGDYYMKVINQYSDSIPYNLTVMVNNVVVIADDRSVVGYNLKKMYRIFTVDQPCKRVKLISNNFNKVVAIHTKNPNQFNRQSNQETQYTFSAKSIAQTQIYFNQPGEWLLISQILQSFDEIRAMTRIAYRVPYVVKCVVCLNKDPIEQCQPNYKRKQKQVEEQKTTKKSSKQINIEIQISIIGAIMLCGIIVFFVMKKINQRKVSASLAVAVQSYCDDAPNNRNNTDNTKNTSDNTRHEQKINKQLVQQLTIDPHRNNQQSDQNQDQNQIRAQGRTQMQIQMEQFNPTGSSVKNNDININNNNNNNNNSKFNDLQSLQQQIMDQDRIKDTRLLLFDKSQQKL